VVTKRVDQKRSEAMRRLSSLMRKEEEDKMRRKEDGEFELCGWKRISLTACHLTLVWAGIEN
jgi:hypothetical protein